MKQERSRATDVLTQSCLSEWPNMASISEIYMPFGRQPHTCTYICAHAHISYPLHIFPISMAAPDSWGAPLLPPEARQHLVLIMVSNNRSVCITGCLQ